MKLFGSIVNKLTKNTNADISGKLEIKNRSEKNESVASQNNFTATAAALSPAHSAVPAKAATLMRPNKGHTATSSQSSNQNGVSARKPTERGRVKAKASKSRQARAFHIKLAKVRLSIESMANPDLGNFDKHTGAKTIDHHRAHRKRLSNAAISIPEKDEKVADTDAARPANVKRHGAVAAVFEVLANAFSKPTYNPSPSRCDVTRSEAFEQFLTMLSDQMTMEEVGAIARLPEKEVVGIYYRFCKERNLMPIPLAGLLSKQAASLIRHSIVGDDFRSERLEI